MCCLSGALRLSDPSRLRTHTHTALAQTSLAPKLAAAMYFCCSWWWWWWWCCRYGCCCCPTETFSLRYGNSTQLVFSGIGNVHAVKDAFEEMRDSLDPVKTESKMDRWRDDSSKMVAKRVVSFWTHASCSPRPPTSRARRSLSMNE